MKELIEKEIANLKEALDEDVIFYTEEDVRRSVYEDLRDSLMVLMSDVSY